MAMNKFDVETIKERFNEDAWRRIYSVYRALHDSTCPRCGFTQGDFHCRLWDTRRIGVVMQCPSCNLYVTETQERVILAMVEHINKTRISAWESFQAAVAFLDVNTRKY